MPAREPEQWAGLALGPGVRLLLGWRDRQRSIAARPVRVSSDIAATLTDACRGALERIGALERRIYSGIPALETGQYLSLAIEPEPAADGDPAEPSWLLPEEMAATAQMLSIVDEAFESEDWLTRGELAGARGWLFYAVVVELADGSGEVLAFVRRYNPQRGLSAGRLQLAARGSTLKRFNDPLFNLDLSFDLVIAPDEIAILAVSAFNSVFADIEVAKLLVPEHAQAIADGLALSVTGDSQEAIRRACEESTVLANRVRRLAHAGYLGKVDLAAIHGALDRHGIARQRLGQRRLKLAGREDVEVLFDLLEGLYYEADFTGEARRAIRFSVRG